MRRYGDMDFFMDMDGDEGIELVFVAIDEDRREEAYQMYLAQVPMMDKDSFVTFDKYYSGGVNKSKPKKKVSKEEVMDSVQFIMENLKI